MHGSIKPDLVAAAAATSPKRTTTSRTPGNESRSGRGHSGVGGATSGVHEDSSSTRGRGSFAGTSRESCTRTPKISHRNGTPDIGSARYRGDTWDTRDSNNDKRGMGSAGHYISRQHRPAPRHDAVGDFSSRLSADPTGRLLQAMLSAAQT